MAFSIFNSCDEQGFTDLLSKRDSDNTNKTVKASVAVLQHYLEAKGKVLEVLERAPREEFDDVLRKFYPEVRKEDGTRYAKKSMVTLRYGLQKHFLRSRQEDIINDKKYARCNEMFKAVLVQMKKEGVGECAQKEPITAEDMGIIYNGSAFNAENPEGLQRKVMFEYLYFFCSRGRENLRELKKDDFTIGVDSSGRDYVAVAAKQTKNNRDLHDMDNKQGRMYDKPGNPNCPVASFITYVSKLHPDITTFWQKPKRNFDKDSDTWYDNIPVGKNTLYSFMQRLSHDFNLSRKYTNHCVRTTSITTLDHKGIKARRIIGVSGHKSENSIKSYSATLSDDKRRQMSDILSENIAPVAVSCKHIKICTNSTTSTSTSTIALSVPSQPRVTCPAQVPDYVEMMNDDDSDIDKLLFEDIQANGMAENPNLPVPTNKVPVLLHLPRTAETNVASKTESSVTGQVSVSTNVQISKASVATHQNINYKPLRTLAPKEVVGSQLGASSPSQGQPPSQSAPQTKSLLSVNPVQALQSSSKRQLVQSAGQSSPNQTRKGDDSSETPAKQHRSCGGVSSTTGCASVLLRDYEMEFNNNTTHCSLIMKELHFLWKRRKFMDASLQVGEMQFPLHRVVLLAASPSLQMTLDHFHFRHDHELVLRMPSDITQVNVYQFLNYVYSGHVKLKVVNVVAMLRMALMFSLEHLAKCCRTFISMAVRNGSILTLADEVETPPLIIVERNIGDLRKGKSTEQAQGSSSEETSDSESRQCHAEVEDDISKPVEENLSVPVGETVLEPVGLPCRPIKTEPLSDEPDGHTLQETVTRSEIKLENTDESVDVRVPSRTYNTCVRRPDDKRQVATGETANKSRVQIRRKRRVAKGIPRSSGDQCFDGTRSRSVGHFDSSVVYKYDDHGEETMIVKNEMIESDDDNGMFEDEIANSSPS